MRRAPLAAAVLTLVALGALGLWWVQRPAGPVAYSANVVDYLSDASAQSGFERVLAPRAFDFPADFGPHPAYQTEWWYYTGNVADDLGRRYGFQLTFFRRALEPLSVTVERASAWGASQVYLAHFTVTDVDGGTFHSAERLARGAAGLAGATADPFRVWVEDWSANQAGPLGGQVRLRAAEVPVEIDITLEPSKPPARHGRDGFSPKGPEAGNASYYYSYSRLAASGTMTTTTGAHSITGTAWMDHEWSTSALAADQVGWDWFSLQLDDERELMLFQLRQADGQVAAESAGSLIAPDGTVTPLAKDDFMVKPTGNWTSPRTGGTYPSGWRVTVPAASLDLTVTPLARDQELATGLRYWEGAVKVEGVGSVPVSGHGYVELTGYIEAARGGALPGMGSP